MYAYKYIYTHIMRIYVYMYIHIPIYRFSLRWKNYKCSKRVELEGVLSSRTTSTNIS